MDDRNQLIEIYYPLVKRHAVRMAAHLPDSVTLEDLVSSGIFGLIDSIRAFDPSRKVRFETFSTLRIRGAMLDAIRAADWVPRSVRTKARRLSAAIDRLTSALGRSPTEAEVAADMGLSASELSEFARAAYAVTLVSIDSTPVGDGSNLGDPTYLCDILPDTRSDATAVARSRNWMRMAAEWLKPKELRLIRLLYWRGLTMKQIGRRLGLSESRISQMHDGIVRRLRGRLAGTEQELEATE